MYRNKSSMVTYIFSAYFIPIYFSFIIVKNCGFVTGLVIFAIYFRLKKQFFITICYVKTQKTKWHGNIFISIIRYINLWSTPAIFSEYFNGFSYLELAWYSILNAHNILSCSAPNGIGHLLHTEWQDGLWLGKMILSSLFLMGNCCVLPFWWFLTNHSQYVNTCAEIYSKWLFYCPTKLCLPQFRITCRYSHILKYSHFQNTWSHLLYMHLYSLH